MYVSSVVSRYLKLMTHTLLLTGTKESSGRFPFGIFSVYDGPVSCKEGDSNHKLNTLIEKLPVSVTLNVVELRLLILTTAKLLSLNSLNAYRVPDSAKLYVRRASLGVAELVVAVVNRETMVTPSIPKIKMTTMR